MAYINVREKNVYVYIIMIGLYSMLGAIVEHFSYATSHERKEVKNAILPGFPIWALGAYMAVLLHRAFLYKVSLMVEFIVYAVIMSLMELYAGFAIGAGPKLRNECGMIEHWDYSDSILNYRGMIDLRHFLSYGVMGIIVVRFHPRIVQHVNKMFDS